MFQTLSRLLRVLVRSAGVRPAFAPVRRWIDPRVFPLATVTLGVLAAYGSNTGTALAQSDGVELIGQFEIDPEQNVTYNDVWGYSAPDGTEIAILGSNVGTHFIDVTDPATPHQVGFISGEASIWRDMKTYGHFAYSVNELGGGLQVIDLADPLDPVLVNVRQAQFSTAHNIFVDESAGTLWAVGAARGTPDNVFVYSLEPDPSSPTYITSWSGAYLHDIYVRDGLAYGAALNQGELWILDVSELPIIEVLGAVETPGNFTHNTWLTDDGRYCLTTDENAGGHVGIVDVQDPTAPVLVAEWSNPDGPRTIVHNAFVLGDHAYVSWYTTGLQILDLRDPLAPTRAAYYDTYPGTSSTFDGAWGVYPYSRHGYTYISDISTGLYIVRFDGARTKVSGMVRDDSSDAPLPGVFVSVTGSPETATTDEEGAYSLRLLPGTHELNYSLFGYLGASESVTLDRTPVDGVDVTLAPAPIGRVDGVVETAEGEPVEGVRVRILEGNEGGASGALLEARTDGSGRFAFSAVPTGERTFRLESFGFPTEERTVSIATGENELRFVVFLARYLDDFEGEETQWTVGGPNDTATSGVWERALPPALEGNSSQPQEDHSPEGSEAFLTGAGGAGDSESDHDVDGGITTLTSPVYGLTGMIRPGISFYYWYVNANDFSVPDDEFVVEASADGGASWSSIFRTGEGEASWRFAEIFLGPESASAEAFQLRFLASDLGELSRVEAAIDDLEVFDARGRIAGRIVSLGSGLPVADGVVTETISGGVRELDEEGRFEWISAPGGVDVLVQAFGFLDQTVTLEVPSRRTLEATIALVPMPTQPVTGTVRASDGTPLPGILVECVETPLSSETDEEGRWSFDVPIGDYRVRFSSNNFAPVEREVEVSEAGGPVRLDIELSPSYITSVERVFPNPTSGETVLRFRLARSAQIRLEVFDPAGRRVRTVWDGNLGVGEHELRWDGSNDAGAAVSAGLYFQRFRGDGVEEVQRVIRIP